MAHGPIDPSVARVTRGEAPAAPRSRAVPAWAWVLIGLTLAVLALLVLWLA